MCDHYYQEQDDDYLKQGFNQYYMMHTKHSKQKSVSKISTHDYKQSPKKKMLSLSKVFKNQSSTNNIEIKQPQTTSNATTRRKKSQGKINFNAVCPDDPSKQPAIRSSSQPQARS